MKINNRLNGIPNYYFKNIEDIREKMEQEGKEIFDFSIGDPDVRVHDSIKNAFAQGIECKDYNKYPPYEGIDLLKQKIIKYYKDVFSISLKSDEVIILIGSKEGINNIIPSVCDVGDYAVIPQPGYPAYETCCNLWGVKPYKLNMNENSGYLPDYGLIPQNIVSVCKLLFINYPNNPTGAAADENFYRNTVDFCRKNNIVVCSDSAYNEIINPDENPISILKFCDDKKSNTIEVGTFSKTFSMTGFRVGYAAGNADIINSLLKVKSSTDSGQFKPLQIAAAKALDIERKYIKSVRNIYYGRRIEAQKILKDHNISYYEGKGTFYLWCKIPQNYTTDEFCEEVLKESGIIFTPGYVFGTPGYGYFRISLTKNSNTIREAFSKLKIY